MAYDDYMKLDIDLLLVEDDLDSREEVMDILSSCGMANGKINKILLAGNGSEGLEIFTVNKPMIVLTDIRMPLCGGLEMAKKIKQLAPRTKIIVITAFDEIENLIEAFDIGINYYILKPVKLENLLNALDKCMEIITLERQVAIQNDKLRLLTSELTMAEEKERRRIALKLHDYVLQNLALALIKIDDLREYTTDKNGVKIIDNLQELIGNSVDLSRDLTFELSPPVLFELGLKAALEWLVEDIQKKEPVRIYLNCPFILKDLDDDVKIYPGHESESTIGYEKANNPFFREN